TEQHARAVPDGHTGAPSTDEGSRNGSPSSQPETSRSSRPHGDIVPEEVRSAREVGDGQEMIFQDGRILSTVKGSVCSDKDGRLLCLATEISPEEAALLR